MNDMYKALMSKKKGKGNMDDDEMKSKMGVLKDIHDMASNDLGHDIKGIKKVSVMSDSDEGMKQGLKMAGEIAAHKQGHSMADDDADDVSDDMHPESRRHNIDKHSEMNDEADGMADSHGDEPQKGKKAMEGYADGGEVEHQHDQSLDFMENGPEEISKEWGPGKNYAEGGMIHPGQYGEAQADVRGTPHQHRQDHGMNTQYAQPTMKKEWDQSKDNYADGGMVAGPKSDDYYQHEADGTGSGKQSRQSKGMDTKAAGPTISKEKDTDEVQKFNKVGSKEMGTHGTHASPDASDEYSDLEPEELEALISHLQRFRKSNPSF